MGSFMRQASYTGAPGQQWNLISVGNGRYEITNVASGQPLDFTAGAPAARSAPCEYFAGRSPRKPGNSL
jgi:hypothetical protein